MVKGINSVVSKLFDALFLAPDKMRAQTNQAR